MAVTTPPLITPLPAPPDPNNRASFNALAYPWASSLNGLTTQVAAVAANIVLNANDAASSTTSAETARGSAQTFAATATTQAGLATTNGAAQVALATTQANLATTQAGNASTSAAAAEASRISASKLNLGDKTSAPTVDNQGAALLAGATYFDTTLNKWRVWSGTAFVDGISAVAGVSSVNGETGAVVLALLRNVAYDNRASLRALSPANGDAAIVTGLGLFVWESASTEPDDDESAFATASGVWLMQAASWDLVDSWSLVDEQAQEDDDEDEPLRFAASFAASFAAKVLTGSVTCAVTSVASGSSVSFTGTVTGAAIGDRVVATPPAQLGSDAAQTGRLSFHAFVSAANTVTIVLTNASAAAATTNAAIQATWPVTVIKT